MDLDCSLEVAAADDKVAFAFVVENAGDDDAELSFPSAMTHDVAVLDGGEEVWRWSDGQMFAQMLGSETLAPGESVTYEVAWDAPRSGEYEAVAELAANNADCETRTTFEV